MKYRILNILFALTVIAGSANGQSLSVQPIEAQTGEQAQVIVSLTGGTSATALQFNLKLPDGISVNANSATLGAATDGHVLRVESLDNGDLLFVLYSMDLKTFKNGELLSIPATAGNSATTGTGQLYTVRTAAVSGNDAVSHECDNAQFNVTITDLITVLDESSTTAPTAATGANVRVKRSIKANEWSTICLPFAMTETLVKAAFGNDVQLADFTGWETTEKDGGGNALGIRVDFSSASAIEANHPYIIKVSSPITEFTVDGVVIDPDDEPSVTVGSGSTLGTFTGSYVPMTIDAENLFLSGNEFWYSAGATQMKGYRGYFHFADVLAAYYASAPVKMKFTLDGTTGIEEVKMFDGSNAEDTEIYDLSGRRVEKAGKGIYIINNKKVLVK